MNPSSHPLNLPWIKLQAELRDLAFDLDRRGNPTAADLATTIAARIGEVLVDDLKPGAPLQRALLN